jgi:CDP-glucose 4,6-dehydratase
MKKKGELMPISSPSLRSFFSGKRVLVTGHTGFKGSWLCQMLLHFGARVSGYALSPNTSPNLYSILGLDEKVSSHIGDIRNYDSFLAVLKAEKPEIVFHLAAQPLVRQSYDQPIYTFQTNVMGTAHVLEALRQYPGVKAGVMITTDKVYENPEDGRAFVEDDALGGWDPYSASKAADEIIISSYIRSYFKPALSAHQRDSHSTLTRLGGHSPLLIASARAGNVIGGGDWSAERLIPDIIAARTAKRELVLRNPQAIRPWQHVLDPIYGYLLLAKGLYEGNTALMGAFNFSPGSKSSITVEQMAQKAGVKYRVQLDEDKHEAQMLRLDSSKARRLLGWKDCLDPHAALDWTLDWYQQQASGQDMKTYTRRQMEQYLAKVKR